MDCKRKACEHDDGKREKSKFRKRDLFGWLVMLPTVVLFTFCVGTVAGEYPIELLYSQDVHSHWICRTGKLL